MEDNELTRKALGKIIGVSMFLKDMPNNNYAPKAFIDVIEMLTSDLESAYEILRK